MRLDWLPAVLTKAGVPVKEYGEWKGLGVSLQEIRGLVWHHTVTGPQVSDEGVARLLRNGRSDLPGPLSQIGLSRTGVWWVIADGKANHNGYGMWGNQSIGIEAFNDGRSEPWPRVQYESWVAGSAAILKHLGMRPVNVLGHKETDPDRKIDPNGIDMTQARADIGAAMKQGAPLMVKIWRVDGDDRRWGVLYVGPTPICRWHIKTAAEVTRLKNGGATEEPQSPATLKSVTELDVAPV
jgi:hypothetical protein